jgi:hypothetical protein
MTQLNFTKFSLQNFLHVSYYLDANGLLKIKGLGRNTILYPSQYTLQFGAECIMQHGKRLNQHIHGCCWLLEQAVTSIGGEPVLYQYTNQSGGNQCWFRVVTIAFFNNHQVGFVLFFLLGSICMGNQYQFLKWSIK